MWFPSQNVAYSTEAEKMELSFETALTGSTDNHIIQAALYWGEYLNLDEEIPFFTTDVNSKGGIMELDTVETIDITSQKSLFNGFSSNFRIFNGHRLVPCVFQNSLLRSYRASRRPLPPFSNNTDSRYIRSGSFILLLEKSKRIRLVDYSTL